MTHGYRMRIKCLILLMGSVLGSAQAATMNVVVGDGQNEGLNNPTPVAPIGGNRGETLGQQRLIALQYAADILGSRIASAVPIRIAAQFNNMGCRLNQAQLGSAAPTISTANFAGARRSDVFYPVALANAQSGSRLSGTRDDIGAVFNSALDAGDATCLQGTTWYYGLDGARPRGQVNFISTAVHELTHGLGFVSLVALQDTSNIQAGQFPATARNGARLPDIFSSFIQDLSFANQPLWPALTDAQRRQSLTNGPNVVWSDANTSSQAATLLDAGFNQGRVMLYAPATVEPGSSISHWDTSLDPDQIMEPVATGHDGVTSGIGLSACVLEDIGWQLINGTRCPDVDSAAIAGAPDDVSRDVNTVNVAGDSGNGTARSGDDDDNNGGGGGGCTIAADARFDPLWFALLLCAAGALGLRRRRRG
ncbi:JDVT-CTERM domain-containing protein [Salinisphaera aquimarina]|uniref:JDVT-CTERM domain-containing protein n=1 Tax=Salinisphaera aquimarina TaxID=2094031 RepID=A0ABV7EWD9_9GAMM